MCMTPTTEQVRQKLGVSLCVRGCIKHPKSLIDEKTSSPYEW